VSGVEPWLVQYLPRAQAAGVALDVGANEGDWTRALADRCDAVHAFEPNPQVATRLRVAVAPYRNVRLVELALGDRVGDIDLDLYERSEWATSYPATSLDAYRAGEPIGSITVPCHTIDRLGYQFRSVHYIKIDVEGAECAVLRGAKRTLAASRPTVLTEVHSARNRDWTVGCLRRAGYVVDVITHPDPAVPAGHCWVLARPGLAVQ